MSEPTDVSIKASMHLSYCSCTFHSGSGEMYLDDLGSLGDQGRVGGSVCGSHWVADRWCFESCVKLFMMFIARWLWDALMVKDSSMIIQEPRHTPMRPGLQHSAQRHCFNLFHIVYIRLSYLCSTCHGSARGESSELYKSPLLYSLFLKTWPRQRNQVWNLKNQAQLWCVNSSIARLVDQGASPLPPTWWCWSVLGLSKRSEAILWESMRNGKARSQECKVQSNAKQMVSASNGISVNSGGSPESSGQHTYRSLELLAN